MTFINLPVRVIWNIRAHQTKGALKRDRGSRIEFASAAEREQMDLLTEPGLADAGLVEGNPVCEGESLTGHVIRGVFTGYVLGRWRAHYVSPAVSILPGQGKRHCVGK